MSIRARHAVQGQTPGESDRRESQQFGEFSLGLVREPTKLPPMGAASMWVHNPGTAEHTRECLRTCPGLSNCIEPTDVMR